MYNNFPQRAPTKYLREFLASQRGVATPRELVERVVVFFSFDISALHHLTQTAIMRRIFRNIPPFFSPLSLLGCYSVVIRG